MASYFRGYPGGGKRGGQPKGNRPGQSVREDHIAVQTGTVQETTIRPLGRRRSAAGNKINVLSFKGQDQVTSAVVTGKAGCYVRRLARRRRYAVKRAGGKLANTLAPSTKQRPHLPQPLPKAETEFAGRDRRGTEARSTPKELPG